MEYHIYIREKHNKMHLKIEKRYNKTTEIIENTTNYKRIEAYLEEFQNEIKTFRETNNRLFFSLDDNTIGVIHDYPKLKKKTILKPIVQKVKTLSRKNKELSRWILQTGVKSLALILSCLIIGNQTQEDQVIPTEKQIEILNNEIEDTKTLEELTYKENNLQYITDEHKNILVNEKILETKENIIKEQLSETLKSYLPTIGTNKDDERVLFVKTYYNEQIEKYAKITGIDKEIFECIIAQETGKNTSLELNKGGAIGPAQIQYNIHINQEKTLYNIETGETETFIVTDKLLKTIDGNLKTCAAILQEQLINYQGNIFLTIQSYNFGQGAMKIVTTNAANSTNQNVDNFIAEPLNLDWIEFIEKYSLEKEKKTGQKYGNPNYINDTLSFYSKDTIIAKYTHPLYNNDVNTQHNDIEISLKEKQKSLS